MTNPKRDNQYWIGRLKKDGRDDLLADIEAAKLSIYRATQIAGYRADKHGSTVSKLSYHWERATAEERKEFVTMNLRAVNHFVRQVGEELKLLKAQKIGVSEQK